MTIAPELSSVALDWGTMLRPRTAAEAREYVAAFAADREAAIEAIYRDELTIRGGRVDETVSQVVSSWNANVGKSGSRKYDGDYDHFDATYQGGSEGAGPSWKYVEGSGRVKQRMRTQTRVMRDEAERLFDERMRADTPEGAEWRAREAVYLELWQAIGRYDEPFADPPPPGVFGMVAVDAADVAIIPARSDDAPATVARRKRRTGSRSDDMGMRRDDGTAGYAAYIRVSTALQGDSGLGLEAQERAIMAAATLRGVTIGETVAEVVSGAARKLPLRDELLERCRRGELAGIVVSKLDRLARNASGLLALAEDAQRHGYRVIVCDPGVVIPGETANDRMFIGMLSVFAEFEREQTSERTTAALAEARARGVKLGRPSRLSSETVALIRDLDARGMGLSAIARELNDRGIPSATGGQWRHSSVREVLLRDE